VVFGAPNRFEFESVDPDADTVTFTTATGLQTGDAFIYSGAQGAHVGGLVSDTLYYAIVNRTSDVLQVAATAEDAAAGVAIALDLAPRFLVDGGTGTFSDSGQVLGTGFTNDVALGDVDGDGDVDAFVANSEGPTLLFVNQGGLQGGVEGIFVDSGQALGNDGGFVLGDVDGDGDVDALISTDETRVYLNQGGAQGGQVGVFEDSGQVVGSNAFVEALGDVDSDGDLDVFLLGDDTLVFLNQGGAQGG